jgi:2-oxoglutarate/2-oxoacid ferredoxin oxidoreductase subunit alpha
VPSLSHGDTKHPMLLPASVGECYTMAMEAFDLAERLQTLVFVMSDLDLGMNTWMSDIVPVSRGAARPREAPRPADVQRLGTEWGRYKDVDGDGIPYRTLPGDGLPAYFTAARGTTSAGSTASGPTTT